MTITILGLGPGDPAHLTCQAWRVLSEANEVYLRTQRHPTVAGLPAHLTCHSFDHLYETLEDFATVYEAIAEQIMALGRRPGGVLYAVPGHPLVGESSVQRILVRAREEDQAVRLVEGLSFVEPVLSLLGIDGLAGLQLADATDLAGAHHPFFDPDRPALVAGALALLCGALLGIQLVRSAVWATRSHEEGFEYSSRTWRYAPAVEYLRRLPAETPIYSNRPQAIYFLVGRRSHPVVFAPC